MKIRSKTISYAAMKKRLDEKKEKDLESSIQSLEAKVVLTENEKRKLEKDKQELVAIRNKRMEGVCFARERDGLPTVKKLQNTFVDSRNVII